MIMQSELQKQTWEHSESANLRQGQNLTDKFFTGGGEHIVSWFDFETCFKVIEDSAIGQNTYDFLLVFYSNFDRISCRFCATVDHLTGLLWPLNDSEGQSGSPPKWNHLRLGQDLALVKRNSCKSMHNILREAAHRHNDRKTDLIAQLPSWRR